MTSKSFTGLMAGAIALTVAGAAAGQTLTSAKTGAAPVLDGAGGAEWAGAEPISVNVNLTPYKPSNGYEGITQSTVSIRSMHDDASVYFLIEWDDPTQSLARFPWVKQEDGSWKQLANKDDTGHDNTYYEDKFAMLWDINARGFDKKGCDAACHMGQDGMVNGTPSKSPGRKYTVREGQTIDMWHWKGVRTGPLSQIDDQFIDNTTDPAQNSGWGRKSDVKTAGGYSDNLTEDKTMPAVMPADGKPGAYWVEKANAVPFVDNFAAGDIVPGIVISPFEGPRADIAAHTKWADGKWTMEIARALVTTGEKSDTQDVQFSDLSAEYPFGVAVFDNSQINHVYHEGVLTLRFAN